MLALGGELGHAVLDFAKQQALGAYVLAAQGAVELGIGIDGGDGGQGQVDGHVVLGVERVDEAPEGHGLARAGLAGDEQDAAGLFAHLEPCGELLQAGPAVELAAVDGLVEGSVLETEASLDHDRLSSSWRLRTSSA